MTDRPINLNRFRKAKARADRRAQADANAQRFGRTKAERNRDAAEEARADRQLDAHRLNPDTSDE